MAPTSSPATTSTSPVWRSGSSTCRRSASGCCTTNGRRSPRPGRRSSWPDPSAPVILLAHQPVQFTEAAQREVDLQLSGHTHGGQMVPFNYLVRLDQPAVAGLSRVGGSQLDVTRGVGTWGPPVRVGAPPEITVIELHSRS